MVGGCISVNRYLDKKRKLITVMVLIVAIAGSGINSHTAKASNTDNNKLQNMKDNESMIEVDLNAEAATVQFTLESSKGPFLSALVFPSGYKIEAVKSNKIANSADANIDRWQTTYVINRAPAGKYRFIIETDAASASYVRMTYHVPLFADILNHWGEKQIAQFVKNGIVSGVGGGMFAPDRAVTKEAFVKMLVLALTEEQQHGERQWMRAFRWKVFDEDLRRELGLQQFNFSIDKQQHWSVPFIEAAAHLGIKLDMDQNVRQSELRRDEAAAIAAAVLRLSDEKSSKEKAVLDLNKQNLYKHGTMQDSFPSYQEAIERVQRFSIIKGYPNGDFKSERSVTRAEAVMILTRLQQYYMD